MAHPTAQSRLGFRTGHGALKEKAVYWPFLPHSPGWGLERDIEALKEKAVLRVQLKGQFQKTWMILGDRRISAERYEQ
jgi:hypothetical protein